MPCSDSGYGYNDCREEVQKIHKLTEMLCELCTMAEENGLFNHTSDCSPDLVQWWREHKKEDVKRIKAERLARAAYMREMKAYNKLNPADRKLLGVKEPRKP